MYPSKPNTNADASNRSSETSQLTAPTSASGGTHGPPPADFSSQSGNPSAPLLPSSPRNPDMDPPPYSSIVAQGSGDWRNPATPYPPAAPAPYFDQSRSTNGFQNPAPYPTGSGSGPGPAAQPAPYPSYGPPAQAPYPSGPGAGPAFGSMAPYPPGPGSGSGITSDPPYPNGSVYNPGLGSAAPYPGAMPMPSSVDASARQIGFTAPVTVEPKPLLPIYPVGEYVQGQGYTQSDEIRSSGNQVGQEGLIYPIQSGGNGQYAQAQYVPNQYGQQPPPNTVYVVQNTPQKSSTTDDDCCCLVCCLASCYCFVECLKICATTPILGRIIMTFIMVGVCAVACVIVVLVVKNMVATQQQRW